MEVALAKECQCHVELRLEQFVDVFRVNRVDGLPLDIDKSWVAHDNIVVSQFQIDRHLFREIASHCDLCVLRDTIDQLKAGQVDTRECLSDIGAFRAFHAKVVEDELELVDTLDAHAVDLRANVKHYVEKRGQRLLDVFCQVLVGAIGDGLNLFQDLELIRIRSS